MDYFRLMQDRRYRHIPEIKGFYSMFKRKDFMEDEAIRIPDKNVVFTDSNIPLDRVDVIDHQMFAVAKEVRDVFRMYEPAMAFKHFCMVNNVLNEYMRYFAPVLNQYSCLSRYEDRAAILSKEKLGESGIFRVQGTAEDMVVIRLDVAESLLRRGIRGFVLEKVIWDT